MNRRSIVVVGLLLTAVATACVFWMARPAGTPAPAPSHESASPKEVLGPARDRVLADVERVLVPPRSLRITVLDAQSRRPVPEGRVLVVARDQRFCTTANSRHIATTDSLGLAHVNREDLPSDASSIAFVAARRYVPRSFTVAPDSDDLVLGLTAGFEVVVRCTNELDGTVLPGARVALSRTGVTPHGLLGWLGAAPDPNAPPSPNPDHAVYVAQSDHRGIARLEGVPRGIFRLSIWHDDAAPVSGLPSRERIDVPGPGITVGFRALYGLHADVPKRKVYGRAVQPRPGTFQMDNGWGVAAGTRLYRRLTTQHPNSAIVAGLPRPETAQDELRATAAFLIEGVGCIERELPLRPVKDGGLPIDLVTIDEPSVPDGRVRITLLGPDDRRVAVPVELRTRGIRLNIPCGEWTVLPPGEYAYGLWDRVAPEVAGHLVPGHLKVSPGADCDVERRIDAPLFPCDLEVGFPYDDRGTVVIVEFARGDRVTARMVNWSPTMDPKRVWLEEGPVTIRAYGVDLVTPKTSVVIAAKGAPVTVSLTLVSTAVK